MQNLKRFALFVAGLIVGIVVALSYDFERFIPMMAAFGLLCFICGLLVMQFIALRKQEQKALEETVRWMTETTRLTKERAEWEAEKESAADEPDHDS